MRLTVGFIKRDFILKMKSQGDGVKVEKTFESRFVNDRGSAETATKNIIYNVTAKGFKPSRVILHIVRWRATRNIKEFYTR